MKNKDIIKKHAKEFIKNFILFIILMLVAFLSFSRLIHKDKSDSKQNDSTDETEIFLAEQIEDKVKSIEERYECIHIICNELLSDELSNKDYSFTYEISNNERKKLIALEKIDTILERLPDNIFEEALDLYGGKFREKYSEYSKDEFDEFFPPYNKINIVLCSEIKKGKSDGVYTGGMTCIDNNNIVDIFISIKYPEYIERCFAHELYHFFFKRIDMQAIVLDVYIGKEWNSELPKDYEYYGSKTNLKGVPYTVKTEEDINNVYFVTEYSQTNIKEDRAEIFSYLLSTDEDEELPKAYESPHVRNRALMIIREFDECYDTVDENAYWNRIFEEKTSGQ